MVEVVVVAEGGRRGRGEPGAGVAAWRRGGVHANWVPVTTVTWAPSVVGPEGGDHRAGQRRATAWAAAWSAGDLVA